MRLEYTEQVQEVLAVMEDCAQRMRYGYVGTEHLLYGLLCCEDVTAWRLLTENGADLTFVEKYLETNKGEKRSTKLPAYSEKLLAVLEQA